MSANVLVVPGLPQHIPDGTSASAENRGLQLLQAELMDSGNEVVTLPGLPLLSEYDMDNHGPRRAGVTAYVDAQEALVARAAAVVVVNNIAEVIRDPHGARICEIPHSVGRLPLGIMGLANKVYGKDSGRVFLSDRYPEVPELCSANSTRRSVIMARARLLGVYPLRPVVLNGQTHRLIEKVQGG